MPFTTNSFLDLSIDQIIGKITDPARLSRQQAVLDFGDFFNKNDRELRAQAQDLYAKAQQKKAQRIEEEVRKHKAEYLNTAPTSFYDSLEHFGARLMPDRLDAEVRRRVKIEADKISKQLGIDSPNTIFKKFVDVRRRIYDDFMVPDGKGGFTQDGWVHDKKHADSPNKIFPREAITNDKLVDWGFNDLLALQAKQDPNAASGLIARLNQQDDTARRIFRMDFAKALNVDNNALDAMAQDIYPKIQARIAAIANAEAQKKADEIRNNAVTQLGKDFDARLSNKASTVDGQEEQKQKMWDSLMTVAGVKLDQLHKYLQEETRPNPDSKNNSITRRLFTATAKAMVKTTARAIGMDLDQKSLFDAEVEKQRDLAVAEAMKKARLTSPDDVKVALARLRGNAFDHNYVKTADGSFRKDGMLPRTDSDATSSFASNAPEQTRPSGNTDSQELARLKDQRTTAQNNLKANQKLIADLIDKGMEEKRKTGGLFDTPLTGQSARRPMGFAGTISDRTISALKSDGTVIIGNQQYDLSDPRKVAQLKSAALNNYNGFINGHMVPTKDLKASQEANKRVVEAEAKQIPATRTATVAPPQHTNIASISPKVELPSNAGDTRRPVRVIPTAREPAAEQHPPIHSPQRTGAPVRSSSANMQGTASISVERRKELREMAVAYLTGDNIKNQYHHTEVKKLFQQQIAAITRHDPRDGLNDGRFGAKTEKVMREYLAQEGIKLPYKGKPPAAPNPTLASSH